MGILAKAQNVVSRISGGSRHTMSGHGMRSMESVDGIVHVRDFAKEGKMLEDEDEITVIPIVEKRG